MTLKYIGQLHTDCLVPTGYSFRVSGHDLKGPDFNTVSTVYNISMFQIVENAFQNSQKVDKKHIF